MKRAITLILCAALALCALPAGRTAAAAAGTPALSQTAPLKARQYGEEQELVVDQNGFAGQIRYPAGDVEDIDTVLLTWASLTMSECEKQAQAGKAGADGVKATIDVDYEAFESASRYVGIEEYGTYRLNGKDAPGYLLYTFNYDLAAGKPLALFEVIDEAHMDAVIALVQKKLAEASVTNVGSDGVLAKDDMHEFVLRDDGVEWLFLTDTGIVGALVAYDELLGYLSLAEATPAPTVTPAPTEKPAIEQTAVCIHDGSHIRSGPGTEYDLLGTVNANDTLEVVKSNAASGWHEIWYNGGLAYIAATLVRLSTEPTKLITGWVTSDFVHIRAGAGTKYAIVGTLNYQDKVEIIQKDVRGHWHKIWFNDQVAYVYDKYVHIGSQPVNTPDPAAATPAPEEITPRTVSKTSVSVSEVGTCTTNGVIVRSARSIHADYYGKLSAGEQVYILEYGDAWCEIYVPVSNNNGYIGYAHTKYLSISTPEVTEAQQENPKIIAGFAGGMW